MPTLELIIDARQARTGATQFEAATRRVQASSTTAATAVQRLGTSVAGLNARVGAILGPMRGLLTALVGIGGATHAIRTIGGFERTMATIQGVTSATAEEMRVMTATARELGATTRFSAQEAGEGLLFLSRAGFTTQQGIAAIGDTLNLAAAGSLELGEAADFASNILQAFRLEAEQMNRVVDTLINSANSANTDVRQLAEAMKFAAPIAGTLGIQIEETAAAIGVLGDVGIQGSMAGTNLRMIMVSLLRPSGAARQSLKDLGIELKDLDPTTNSLTDIFQQFADAGLTAAQATNIFSQRAAGGALAITAQVDKMRELTAANKEAAGVAERNAEIMSKTLLGAMLSLKSAIEELFLATGDKGLTGGLTSMVKTITTSVRILAGMEISVEDNTDAARRLAAAFQAIGITIAAVMALKILTFFAKLTTAIGLVTFNVLRLNVVMLLPFIKAIAAISAVVVVLDLLNVNMRKLGETILDVAADLLGSALDWVADRFKFITEGAVKAEKDIDRMRHPVDNLTEGFRALTNRVQRLANVIREAVEESKGPLEELAQEFRKVFAFETPQIAPITALGSAETFVRLSDQYTGVIGELNFYREQLKGLEVDQAKQINDLKELNTQWQGARERMSKIVDTTWSYRRVVQSTEDSLAKLREEQSALIKQQNRGRDLTEEQWKRFEQLGYAIRAHTESLAKDTAKLADWEIALERVTQSENRLWAAIREGNAAIELQSKAVQQAEADLADFREQIRPVANEMSAAFRRALETFREGRAIEPLTSAFADIREQAEIGVTPEGLERLQNTFQQLSREVLQFRDDYERTMQDLQVFTEAEVDGAGALLRAMQENQAMLLESLEEQAHRTMLQLERIKFRISEVGQLLQVIGNEFGRSITRNLEEAVFDAKDLQSVLRDIAEDLARATFRTLVQRFMDSMVEATLDAIAGMVAAAAESSIEVVASQTMVTAATTNATASVTMTSAATLMNTASAQMLTAAQLNLAASSIGGSVSASADGNVFNGGSLMAFAGGGIVSGPTFFPMANGGVGLMGEAGPEAIMPLKRIGGKLGVVAEGGGNEGGTNVIVNVTTRDANSFKQSESQISAGVFTAVRSAQDRAARAGG